ncbi:eight-cysteine-cluster domain-containing protein [Candidatus Woesearchaeota archaeon]|nr:eight-cysteine-cluster domain-containing protein [Candidatus Woesearchaeota archaeon]
MKAGFTAFVLTLLSAVVIVIAACQPLQPQQPQGNESADGTECSTNSDCGIGGCSGQVCTAASEATGVITTCEYRAEYDCLKLTSCWCVEGKCAWKETADYKACVDIKTKNI